MNLESVDFVGLWKDLEGEEGELGFLKKNFVFC